MPSLLHTDAPSALRATLRTEPLDSFLLSLAFISAKSAPRADWESLPAELLEKVLSYLPLPALASCAAVSSALRTAALLELSSRLVPSHSSPSSSPSNHSPTAPSVLARALARHWSDLWREPREAWRGGVGAYCLGSLASSSLLASIADDRSSVHLHAWGGGRPTSLPAGGLVESVAAGGEWVAVGVESGHILLFHAPSAAPLGSLPSRGCGLSLALSGDYLVGGGEGVGVWSLSSMRQIARLSDHSRPVLAVAAGGGVAASASLDRTARVYRLEGVTAATESAGTLHHPRRVSCVSLEGMWAVTGCYDGMVRLWCLGSFSCARVFSHGGSLTAVHLCGGLIASGGGNRRLKLWETDSNSSQPLVTIPLSEAVYGLALSPPASLACASGGDLIVWNPKIE
ncbi:MAG: hypothetical protein SGPRY_001666 [Prymnesium sp.]